MVSLTRYVVVVGAFLVLAGCGAGTEESRADGVVEIASSGGEAVLTLAADSLPEGVSVEDVEVGWALGTSSEQGAPAVGVALLPSGLVLSESATVRFEVPASLGSEMVAIHIDAEGVEFITVEIEFEDDKQYAVATIEHFSALTIHGDMGLFEISSETNPMQVVVKDSQLFTATVWRTGTSVGVWILTSIEDDEYRFYTFEDVEYTPPRGVSDARVSWYDMGETDWKPGIAGTERFEDDDHTVFLAESQCETPNSADLFIMADMPITMKLVAKADVTKGDLLEFGKLLGGETPMAFSNRRALDDSRYLSFTAPVGATVTATVKLVDWADAECVGTVEAGSTSSSSTSSTQPVSDESDDLIGMGDGGEVRDSAWHYAQGLEAASTNIASIDDCDELNPLWESFSGQIGVDKDDAAAVELALALDDIAYERRQELGC